MIVLCLLCDTEKPESEFYGNGRKICRPCNRAKVKLWSKRNPEIRKEIVIRYRNSTKGKTTLSKSRPIWRKRNSSSESERHARYIRRIPDAYCRKLLKQRGVTSPTADQVTHQRLLVTLLRAHRNLALMYGIRTQN